MMTFEEIAGGKGSVYDVGVQLPKQMSNSREAITFSKLDWSVELRKLKYTPVYHTAPHEPIHDITVPNKFATVRVDNEGYLGVVGTGYKIKQNVEAFEFFDAVIKPHNLDYKYAGSLKNDKFIFITAVKDSVIDLGVYSKLDGYFNIINSHDGRTSLSIIFHLVHRNTNSVISIPPSIAIDRISFRHGKKLISEAGKFICDMQVACEKIGELLKMATKQKLELTDIDSYLNISMPRRNVGFVTSGDNIRNEILRMYSNANGVMLMDLYLASIIWTTHKRVYITDESRMEFLIVAGKAIALNRKFLDATNKLSLTIS